MSTDVEIKTEFLIETCCKNLYPQRTKIKMEMSFITYKAIKDIVEAEKKHRAPLDIYWDVFTRRLEMFELVEQGLVDPENVMIKKPVLKDNCSGDRPKKPQSLAELHPDGKVELQKLLAKLKDERQLSIYKQKFFTYFYNKDKTNATKYHEKLMTLMSDVLEDISDGLEAGKEVMVGINNDIHGKKADFHTGEGAYLALADEFKASYELRKNMLGCM